MDLWRRFTQSESRKQKLLEEAQNLREEATLLPFGPLRDAVLKKARRTELAAQLDDWLRSPGLRPLKKDDTPGPN